MPAQLGSYEHARDYARVSAFLIRHHEPGNRDGNWLEPAWEYMHFHPALEPQWLDRIGIWEEGGEIVGVAHYEWRLGGAFLQFHPAYRALREEMLAHAETHLTARREADGRRYLHAFVNDQDAAFLALVQARGYVREPGEDRPMARLRVPSPFPEIALPPGFARTSLAEEPDWGKVHRALWRGFNHEGEPPAGEEELAERRRMFDTPKVRRELKIAVRAPNGEFVAFCGTFYEPGGRFGYVEPVATDPDYRRMGLGRAAVMEGVRRCAALGATDAYVGSDQPFYLALGFEVIYTSQCWRKVWD